MNANTNLSPAGPAQAQSLSKLPIERRIVRFDYSDIKSGTFYAGNPIISAYWAALSSTFPLGEAEFINSVKLFSNRVTDPKLKAEVADFTAQEAHHALQHKKLNKRFEAYGYDISSIESLIQEKIQERTDTWSPKKRLMHTVCAEHVTAVMAHFTLTHPESLDGTPESFQNILLWHSIEEIEHKSVAFDVYKATVGDMGALKRHYLHFIFIEFPLNYYLITRFLLKSAGHKASWPERKGLLKFLFGKGGMFSSVKHLYMSFFKRSFHPWIHDDSLLIGKWKDKLAPYFQNP